MSMLYVALACLSNSLWVLIMLVPAVTAVNLGVVEREERHLEVRFGDDYRSYRQSVRRWL